MARSEPIDIHLVEQAVAGDTVAMKLLLTQSREDLCRLVGKRIPADLRSILDVEDVVQESHIEVFRRIASFKVRGPQSFHRWLIAIALTRLRNGIKRHRALKRGGGRAVMAAWPKRIEDSTLALLDTLAGPGQTPSKSVARQEAINAVQASLAGLPEDYRAALWLVHIEGRSVKSTAAEMGRTERAVHGLCRRGLDLLRQRLHGTTTFLSCVD